MKKKKATKKKTNKKKAVKRKSKFDEGIITLLNDVSDHTKFYCKNGSSFKNLEELRSALKDMDKETFSFHVNSEKNDFASWIYDCVGDIKLAEEIRKVKNKTQLLKKISARVTYIKKKLKEMS